MYLYRDEDATTDVDTLEEISEQVNEEEIKETSKPRYLKIRISSFFLYLILAPLVWLDSTPELPNNDDNYKESPNGP